MASVGQHGSDVGNCEIEISRKDIQAAIAKAVELRALHSALMQGSASTLVKLPTHTLNIAAQDYPVFTPSYEDEPLPGYQQSVLENRKYGDSFGEYDLDTGSIDETTLSDYRTVNAPSIKGLSSELMNLEAADDQISMPDSCVNTASLNKPSPCHDCSKSRRNSIEDIKLVSSCNKCKPAIISKDLDGVSKTTKKSNIVEPVTESQSSLHSQPRNKGLSFSWMFPRLKKKNKNESSPVRQQPEEVSQILKDLGLLSIETLKKELTEAHKSRDAALVEVTEMKSSLGDLSQKMEYLETYCEELKKALQRAVQVKISQPAEKLMNIPKRVKSVDGNVENSMPVSNDVMVEGFLQVVSEARLSVKQFCKTLVAQIEETDNTLVDSLNALLQPYKLSLNSKYSKAVFYHLEAIINQALYQDFENYVFQKNGAPKILDPQQERQAQFQLFVALRNLSWNEVLRKGTKYYSEDFSKFCDHKMSGIISVLSWTRPWPEQLLQAFFVAAKCIWLLHLLAFSFDPALGILRVDENRTFEPHYMDDIFADKQKSQAPSRVKIMVMPGFYVHGKVIRCKVICRYKSIV